MPMKPHVCHVQTTLHFHCYNDFFFLQNFKHFLFNNFSTNEYSYFAYFQMLSLANFHSASFYFLPTFPASFSPFVLKTPPYLLSNLILGPSVNVINVVFSLPTRPLVSTLHLLTLQILEAPSCHLP